MKKILYSGVGTALITPFKNEKVDYNSLELLIEKQLNANIDALIILGTTGEPATISPKERKEIINFCKKATNNKTKLIIGCGSNDTQKAIKLYNQAEEMGADGALIVTPYYNKCSQNGLVEHYKKISENGSLPIIVYNVPSRTGVNILPDTMKSLTSIKNICGLKEANGNINQILDDFAQCNLITAIYSGEDLLNSIFYTLGGIGCISVVSNIFPKLCKKIFELNKSHLYDNMFILQQRLLPFTKALFREVNPIGIKAGLNYLGLCKNELRLPLTPILNENFETLKMEINKVVGLENDCM